MKPFVFLILLAWTEAASVGMPNYDPEIWCQTVASTSGSFSRMILNGCLQQEQQSYDRLAPLWSQLPGSMQSWCDKVARSTGSGSYMLLGGCVEQEQQSGRAASEFRFRR